MQRILAIDDDPAVTSLLKRGLAYEGYAVDIAGTGAAGLALAREHAPGLADPSSLPQPSLSAASAWPSIIQPVETQHQRPRLALLGGFAAMNLGVVVAAAVLKRTIWFQRNRRTRIAREGGRLPQSA